MEYNSWQPASLLQELTCHMESHGVTCYPAEVTARTGIWAAKISATVIQRFYQENICKLYSLTHNNDTKQISKATAEQPKFTAMYLFQKFQLINSYLFYH